MRPRSGSEVDHGPDVRRPGPGRAAVFPARVRGILRVLRDRIPAPAQLTAARIEGAHLAARRRDARVVGDGGARDDEVADHERGRRDLVGRKLEWRLAQSHAQVDHAFRSEVGAGAARRAVDREQARVDRRDEDPPTAGRACSSLFVKPGTDAAVCKVAVVGIAPRLRVEAPALAAGGRIERDQFAERRGEVERAVHHDRRRLEAGMLARLDVEMASPVGPGGFQLRDVRAVDLREWREASAARIAPVCGPFLRWRLGSERDLRGNQQQGRKQAVFHGPPPRGTSTTASANGCSAPPRP